MNTLLKTIALVSAAGFPAAFTVESFGISLPTALNASHMFGAFVVALMLLTMLTDYTGATLTRTGQASSPSPVPASRTALPLAA